MTATNMCSNFGGKWDSLPLKFYLFLNLFKIIYTNIVRFLVAQALRDFNTSTILVCMI